MPTTLNLGISHIDSNQNQKELTANTAFDQFDTAMTDYLLVNIAGIVGDLTPPGIVLEAFIDLVGAQSGVVNLVLPATKRFYTVRHSATGGFRVVLKSATAGTHGTVSLQLGDIATVYSDGTNIIMVSLAQRAITTAVAASTIFAVSGRQVVVCDATTAAFALTLGDATVCNGAIVVVIKKDVSANAVTVTGFSGQNINGANTFALTAQYKFVEITSDGTQWWIVGSN